ncbi:hypothetical protein [Flavobacterium sp. ZB4R12]|uniref:hypothetical protein n=1 Tax=Flavobacterium sp. ZB4R12 TaxID=3398732 RepID=UPI003AADC061
MKKIIMIAGLTILTSCGNKSSEKKDENSVLDSMLSSNDAPKCDDPQLVETVFSILKENEQIIGNIGYPLNDYKNPEITNIITTAKDDELKSCNCEGTASVTIEGAKLSGQENANTDYKTNSNVSYFAQKNDKGEIIVQVNSVDTFR